MCVSDKDILVQKLSSYMHLKLSTPLLSIIVASTLCSVLYRAQECTGYSLCVCVCMCVCAYTHIYMHTTMPILVAQYKITGPVLSIV